MEKLLLFFTLFLTSFAKEENCKNLDGYWYNQLGSEMLLRHGKDGRLTGEYRTAVERKTGSAGVNHSQILGKKCVLLTLYILLLIVLFVMHAIFPVFRDYL